MPDEPSLLSSPPESQPEHDLRGKLVLPASPPPYRTPGVVETKPPPAVPRMRRPEPEPESRGEAPQADPVGDEAGEHLTMDRGRYSAWTYVVIAFVLESLLLGALPIIAFRYAFHFFTSDGDLAIIAGLLVGAIAAWRVFSNRWRCIEAFSSCFCSGLMNLSILYVPFVALVYANARGLAKWRA